MRPAMIFNMGFWININLFKWNRNFFTIMDSNKDSFDSISINL